MTTIRSFNKNNLLKFTHPIIEDIRDIVSDFIFVKRNFLVQLYRANLS